MAADEAPGEYLRPRVPHDRHRHRPGHAAGRDPAQHRRMAFRVGVTSDLFDQRGEPTFGREPLKALDAVVGKSFRPACARSRRNMPPHSTPYVNSSMKRSSRETPNLRLKLVSRHGVGYDSVDVPAMTRAGVLVANTPNAVPRPVATIAFHPRALAPALRQGPSRATAAGPSAWSTWAPASPAARSASSAPAASMSTTAWRVSSTCGSSPPTPTSIQNN